MIDIKELFDLPFFAMLLSANIAGLCARRFNGANPWDLPIWAGSSLGEPIITLINLPFAFGDTLLLASGFLMLPWYTVITCGIAAVLAALVFWNVVFRRIVLWLGLFVAMLISYPIAVLAAVWCFQEEYLIRPSLISSIGIAIVLISRAVTTFYAYQQNKWRL